MVSSTEADVDGVALLEWQKSGLQITKRNSKQKLYKWKTAGKPDDDSLDKKEKRKATKAVRAVQ